MIAVTKYDSLYKAFWDSNAKCGDSVLNFKKSITDSISVATGVSVSDEAVIPVSAVLGQLVNRTEKVVLASGNDGGDDDDDDDIIEEAQSHVHKYRFYNQHGMIKKRGVKEAVRGLSHRNLLSELENASGMAAFKMR